MRFRSLLAPVVGLAGLAACGGTTVDLGGKDAGARGLASDSGAASVDGGMVLPSEDAASSSLSGIYKGYIQSFTFPDGSDVLTMTLALASDGTITGTVYFGTGAPLPPPTDPTVGYPPGYGDSPGSNLTPYEGFDFTVLGGTYTAPPRVQLSIAQPEIWKAWCAIQTTTYPLLNGDGPPDGGCGTPLDTYGCEPNAATMGGAGGQCLISWCQEPAWTPVDCGKLQLCAAGGQGVCICDATSCHQGVGLPTSGNIAFDMRLSGNMLGGTVTGFPGGPNGVFLTRQ